MNQTSKLNTEQSNPKTRHIDTMDTLTMLQTINAEDAGVASACETVLPQVAQLVDLAYERLSRGGRIIYFGAGTSGRLGVLDASECPPTYGVAPTLFVGLIAGGYGALIKSVEGAEDSMDLAAEDLRALSLSPDDTVIGLASSGRTPYVIGGLEYAKQVGALTGSISCVEHAAVSAYSDVAIEVITGPEVIMGSTRMKAGTAQKMILNMISTSLMIKYGKVYGNLMVDVVPSNIKLVERACRIITMATGCSEEDAAKYLNISEHNVKLAICMVLTGKDKESCQALLAENVGNVSKTIHTLKENT
ncbi:MAG: N-acetylmuramic acid 6-phosphate etherase [Oscillospiraceae bacterium]|nr:N-acetylmuramic acid 6-phosphate etherase [Oscillospiraceae bacterium]